MVFTRHWRWNVESKNKSVAKITNGENKKSQYWKIKNYELQLELFEIEQIKDNKYSHVTDETATVSNLLTWNINIFMYTKKKYFESKIINYKS